MDSGSGTNTAATAARQAGKRRYIAGIDRTDLF